LSVVFGSLFPVFAIILIGFGLRKSGLIPADNWKVAENLCFWLLFPALLVKTLVEADFQSIQSGPFTSAIIMFLIAMGAIGLSLWPILKNTIKTRPEQFSTVYQTTTRWNGFVALVIALKLFGDESLTLMTIALALMTIVIQVTNIFVLAAFTPSGRPSVLKIFKTISTNPIIISIVIGGLINVLGIPMWPPLIDMLDLVGRGALGISLLTVGAGLSLAAALRPSKELLVGLVGKLAISPAVMMVSAVMFGLSGIQLSVLIVCSAVPTSMNGYLITKKMGGDAELYATTSTVQTVLSFLTIPLTVWIAQTYFGGL